MSNPPEKAQEIPHEIYRYFSYENGLDFLESGKLKLESPEKFNDVFEFLPSIYLPQTTASRLFRIAATVAFRPSLLLFSINDMIEYKKRMIHCQEFTRKILDMFRVCCFSEINDDLLMWGHYARNHTGIVISFNTAIDYWKHDMCKVQYSSNRINLPKNFETRDDLPLVSEKWQRDLLISKSDCWSYEREWRYIEKTSSCDTDEKNNSYISIDKRSVRKVIFGYKMLGSNKNIIKKIVTDNWPHVKSFEAVPHFSKFSLVMGEIV